MTPAIGGRKVKMIRLILFVWLSTLSTQTWALICLVGSPNLENVSQSFHRASAVVLARAVSKEDIYVNDFRRGYIISFETVHSWKGISDSSFYTKVNYGIYGADPMFMPRLNYLIYLVGPDDEGFYHVDDACTRSVVDLHDRVKNEMIILNQLVPEISRNNGFVDH